MNPSAATLAGPGATAEAVRPTEEAELEEPEKPAEAPSGVRTPPPPVPPVALTYGDDGEDEDEGEEGEKADPEAGSGTGADAGAGAEAGSEEADAAYGVITRRIYLGVPAETAWPWLVDPQLVGRFLLAGLRSKPGGVGDPMQFIHRLGGHILISGEVLEWLEGRRLVFSYAFQREDPEPPSRVSLELLRYGEHMCCLELRHEHLLLEGETWRDAGVAWDVALSSLKTWLETGRPLPWPGRQR